MIISIWFHTHYVFSITTISILKNRPFCNVSYAYGVPSVYTMYIHFMTYHESSYLLVVSLVQEVFILYILKQSIQNQQSTQNR